MLDQFLRRTRRRLFLSLLLNRLLFGGGIACVLTALAVELFPVLSDSIPGAARWWTLGSLLGLAAVVALARSLRGRPDAQKTALLVDERFGLRERVTTALALDESLKATFPGQAILADAVGRLETVKLAEQFPIKLERRSWLMPVPAALLAAAALLTDPLFSATQAEAVEERKPDDAKARDERKPADPLKKPRFDRPELRDRRKSDQLEKLEKLDQELTKLQNDPDYSKKSMTPEKTREAMEKAGDLQEKLKKIEAEKFDQIKRMQEQLQKLTERGLDEKEDGPAKEALQALRGGDFDKAKEEFDKLKKKIQKKELTEADALALKKQIDALKDKSDQLKKKTEAKAKLEKMIDQAKKDGKNTESLEREMKKIEEEAKKLGGMKDLAKKLDEMKQAMDKNDLSELAEKMGELADQFGDLAEEVRDIEELDDSLEELRKFRKQLAGKGKKSGDDSDEISEIDDAEGGGGRGAGRRKINENAKSSSVDERVKTPFDPKGKKRYAGTTDGPAFTKKSLVELEGEIVEAAQDAADSPDVQKLPKGARDSVREYMERLGGQAKPAK